MWRLTGKHRLVYEQAYTFEYLCIGRHFVARLQQNNVANDNVAAVYQRGSTVSQHFNLLMVVLIVQYVELLVGTHLKPE